MGTQERTGDRHLRNPITWRGSKYDRAWVEEYAELAGIGARQVITQAVAHYRLFRDPHLRLAAGVLVESATDRDDDGAALDQLADLDQLAGLHECRQTDACLCPECYARKFGGGA